MPERPYGIIAPAVLRLFRGLKRLPPQSFVGDRLSHQMGEHFTADPESATRRRAWRVDVFVLASVALELTIFFTIFEAPEWLQVVLLAMPILRILNIIEVTVNLNVFDALTAEVKPRVASVVRTLVLTGINYVELIFCFGIIYAVALADLHGAHDPLDVIYFSAITQLSVGYGDIVPMNLLRLAAVAQAMLGLFFTVVLLGRFAGLLPKIRTVAEMEEEK
ncbi:MAG TPA: potassium channel family protein [Gemmatimonadales bacterium]|nr:potassium channel family protein [Gemmatimonadales bacterium]